MSLYCHWEAVHVESRKGYWSQSSWTGQLPLMNNLVWSTFQHQSGPIDPSSQTRVWMSWGQLGPVKPALLPADQLKSSEILRTGFVNYAGPWWTLQTRMSFWWFSHLEWDGNWCDWLSLTWAIFVHPTYGNIYNLSKRTRANGGVHNIINHLVQRAVLRDGVFGIGTVKCTLTPRRTERRALQMTMIQGCFGGLNFVCQFDFDSV